MEAELEETAGVRELKGHLSSYLRRVKQGGTVVITERGKPVARIVPVGAAPEERLAVLRRSGVLAWNGQPLRRVRPVMRARGKPDVASLLIDDRE